MASQSKPANVRWPVFLVAALLLVVTGFFLIEFVTSTQSEASAPEPIGDITADTYVNEVSALLQNANSNNGATLVEQYECIACHRLAVANNSAPAFVGMAERAETRRPPLTPAAYIYESIVYPSAFVLEGFNTVMPQNYGERLSESDLGDIMAFLLSSDAH